MFSFCVSDSYATSQFLFLEDAKWGDSFFEITAFGLQSICSPTHLLFGKIVESDDSASRLRRMFDGLRLTLEFSSYYS